MEEGHKDFSAPRLSATMIVVREASGGETPFELLAIRRSKNMRVLPGFTVFPGGVLDRLDIHGARVLQPFMESQTPSLFYLQEADFRGEKIPRDLLYLALFAAGARELLEETGIYMGGTSLTTEKTEKVRQALLEGQGAEWVELFTGASKWYPCRYVGRRVTPDQVQHRFDTHYFVVQVPQGIKVYPSPSEVESVLWSTPNDLLDRFDQGEIRMAPPTVDALRAIGLHPSLTELMTNAIMPEQVNDDERISRFLNQLSAN